MESYSILWNPSESFGILWNPTESYGILWNPTESFGIQWAGNETKQKSKRAGDLQRASKSDDIDLRKRGHLLGCCLDLSPRLRSHYLCNLENVIGTYRGCPDLMRSLYVPASLVFNVWNCTALL